MRHHFIECVKQLDHLHEDYPFSRWVLIQEHPCLCHVTLENHLLQLLPSVLREDSLGLVLTEAKHKSYNLSIYICIAWFMHVYMCMIRFNRFNWRVKYMIRAMIYRILAVVCHLFCFICMDTQDKSLVQGHTADFNWCWDLNLEALFTLHWSCHHLPMSYVCINVPVNFPVAVREPADKERIFEIQGIWE